MRHFGRTVTGWLLLDSRLHLLGNRELRVENCRKILEYNDVLVRLETRDLTVEIWGFGLTVSDYGDGAAVVRGKLTQVGLAEKG